ncbi:hypothetical protein GCM10020219_079520 [Nonomuraea dietziae]
MRYKRQENSRFARECAPACRDRTRQGHERAVRGMNPPARRGFSHRGTSRHPVCHTSCSWFALVDLELIASMHVVLGAR